jgi:uncharacterized membrane protein HdeD (DUF308 family)
MGLRCWPALALGILAVVVGVVWTLQGLDHLAGSVMTDRPHRLGVGGTAAFLGAPRQDR